MFPLCKKACFPELITLSVVGHMALLYTHCITLTVRLLSPSLPRVGTPLHSLKDHHPYLLRPALHTDSVPSCLVHLSSGYLKAPNTTIPLPGLCSPPGPCAVPCLSETWGPFAFTLAHPLPPLSLPLSALLSSCLAATLASLQLCNSLKTPGSHPP